MRNLIRQPLTWMVIAECIVVMLLVIVAWNVVAAASAQHVGASPLQATDSPAAVASPPLPDLTQAARKVEPAQLPGLNLSAGF